KKPVHWCWQTGTQEYDVNLYQQLHFALWEEVIATQPRTEGQHQDSTPVWRLRGLNPAAAVSARAVLKEYFPKDNLPIGLLYKVVTPGAGITLPA
ncbi:TPA: hypothetical protein ACNG0M_004230, partial [Escherichia coli]